MRRKGDALDCVQVRTAVPLRSSRCRQTLQTAVRLQLIITVQATSAQAAVNNAGSIQSVSTQPVLRRLGLSLNLPFDLIHSKHRIEDNVSCSHLPNIKLRHVSRLVGHHYHRTTRKNITVCPFVCMSQSHLYVTVTRYTITTSRYLTRRLSKHKRRNAVKKNRPND